MYYSLDKECIQRSWDSVHNSVHLEMILSTKNFCSIFSVAFACSTSHLMTKCLGIADSKTSEILKADGVSTLTALAFNEIISRDSFKPSQIELFDAIWKWSAANKNKDAGQLLSNVRLEEMPLSFLFNTVRPAKLFNECRILDAASVVFEKGPKFTIGKWIRFSVGIKSDGMPTLRLNLKCPPNLYSTTTIARVKQAVMDHYNRICSPKLISDGSIALYYQDVLLQCDQTLDNCCICDGSHLIARCK